MNQKEESLDEKIARIRRQNEAIERRKKLIDEEIKDAERNNAIVKLKNKTIEAKEDEKFGATLYSDQLSEEKKVVKSFEDDVWNLRPRQRKSAAQIHNTDEEWREERKRIDEERIQRQKANSGSWKREWDADKTASSNEHDNRTFRDTGNRFNRIISNAERSENRGTYNFNETRGCQSHQNTNEEGHTQNRWKTDNPFQKTYSERRTTDSYDNRKSTRTDNWKTNVSESDRYNNNASKPFLKNISRSVIQNTSFNTKNDQFEEECWDTTKSYSKNNSRNGIQNTYFTRKRDQCQEESLDTTKLHLKNHTPSDVQNTSSTTKNDPCKGVSCDTTKPFSKGSARSGIQSIPFVAKNDQLKEEKRTIKPYNSTQSINPKSKEYLTDGDAQSEVKILEKGSSTVAQNRNKSSLSFNDFVHNKSSSANNSWESKFPDKECIYTKESNSSETSEKIPKNFKNIVVEVKNFGISSDKREVKVLNNLKNNFDVPSFSSDVNTSRETSFKISPSYSSMTFERSDLKQNLSPQYSLNFSSPSPITTQLFSNSGISNSSCLSNDTKSKSSISFTLADNDNKPESFTNFQPATVFQFSATLSKPDFGDIVHNTTTSPDVKIVRTIRNENIRLVKEPPRKNIRDELKKTTDTKTNKNNRKNVEVKQDEVIKKGLEEDEFEEDDAEWDDCSDEEVEEEFV